MGITGLLPFLKDASTQIHISELRNYTVAIDSYCWLHKGAFGCAEKLARGEDTNGYVLYCLKYIKMLQQFNIKPIMVFDGQHLPAKKLTEDKRRKQRQESKKRAQELLRLGKASEAYSYIRRSIDITHKMALALIKECRNMGIDCIVAPYEADSQLAYLNMTGYCHAVISEDSDLVLFGCKKIIYKLDLHGEATVVDAEKIPVCMKLRPDVYTFDKFRYMCILSGCDYLESLPGVGIKKALKFVTMTANPSIYDVLPKLPSYIKLKDVEVTDEYRNQFMIADATFQHQIVYDPARRKLIHLRDPETFGTKTDYLVNAGHFYDEKLAFKMALGNVDPFSLKELDTWTPTPANCSSKSIWSNSYQKSYNLPEKKITVATAAEKEFKVKTLNKNEIEERKAIEDEQLNGELSMYLKCEPNKRKREEEEVKDPPLSPVLNKQIFNPFKKLSKFPKTEINQSEVKVSRYFLRTSKEENLSVESKEVKIKVEESIQELEEKEEIVITVVECEQSVNVKYENVNESDVENNSPSVEENNVVILKNSFHSSSHSSVSVKSTSLRTIKRTTSNSSIGKKNNKPQQKNQPTILSMFNFTKPKQM